jgi:trk system potassium uptake protein TrkA
MRDFAVIGLGNFGSTVAKELKALKCHVTAIDSDKNTVQLLADIVDQALFADATERKFLENLSVKDFDCFIVSTGEDSHASILITLHLKELEAKRIIVKANSREHAKILMKVGASDTVIPEEQMAIRVSHSLAKSNLIDYLPLSADFSVAELTPPNKFVNKSLKELMIRTKYNVLIVAIKHSHTGELDFVPGGDYRIQDTDLLLLLGKQEDIDKINR